jgi:sortase (surface protein transpeptidase)
MSHRQHQKAYTQRSYQERTSYRYSRRSSLDGLVPLEQNQIVEILEPVGVQLNTPVPKASKMTIQDIRPAAPRQERSYVLKRQAVQKAPAIKKKKDIKRSFHINHHNKQWATVAGVLLVVIVGVVGADLRDKSEVYNQVAANNGSGQVKAAEHGVSETEVSRVSYVEHKVQPDQPRYIRIPRLTVDSRIIPSSIMKKTDMEPPVNTHDVNWFEGSAKPGEKGVVLLGGYVVGPTKPGVFYRLGALKPGDQLEIEDGTSNRYIYRVVDLKAYDPDSLDMEAFKSPIEKGKPGLNILTFTDQFDSSSEQSRKRLIVFTVLDPIE